MHWRIELFGGLRAMWESETLTHFRSRKTAALLAHLAFFRGPHPRDQLVELLWPEFPIEAGRNSLRVAIADLRRRSTLSNANGPLVCPPLLQVEHGTVGLSPEVRTDVAEFEKALAEGRRALSQDVRLAAYERAQEVYKGPFLQGLYESWIPIEEARLEASYLYVLKALQGIYESAGDSHRAFEMAQLAARLEPQSPEKSAPFVGQHIPKKRSTSKSSSPEASATRQVAPVPASFTRFFGRHRELQQLSTALLEGHTRLLTLTGGGGMGKTRIALELARRLERPDVAEASAHFDQVLWVPLADTTEAARVPEDLVKILNLTVSTGQGEYRSSLLDSIVQYLNGINQGRTLLVLDNYEQLLPQGAKLLGELLERVPALTLLVTSRQRLNLTGEWEHRIGALTLPLQTAVPPCESARETRWDKDQLAILRESSSVQLFADRARGTRPDWRLFPRDAPALIALLHRLEGVPLAIELVAARIGVLSLDQMVSRLSQSLGWINSRDLHRPARHRSLHAVLEWSLKLLSPQEREIFARLSVFHGGWSLENASAVLSDIEFDVLLESLQSLRDASLINSEESAGGQLRFSMIELVRQIASEGLTSEQRRDIQRSHATFYSQLTSHAANQEKDHDIRSRWGEIEGRNFSAAISFLAENDIERALEMGASLWWYWIFNYHIPEGRHCLRELLTHPEANQFPLAQARAQRCAAYIALLCGDYNEVDELLYAALEVLTESEHRPERASVLNLLGASAIVHGSKEQARDFYAQSMALRREVGPPHELTIAINALAGAERTCGHFDAARLLCTEALERAQTYNDNAAQSWAYHTLGCIELDLDNLTQARNYQEKSLSIRRRAGQLTGQATCLDVLGEIAHREGQLEAARAYYLEALKLWQQVKQSPRVEATQKRLDELESSSS